jgi:hypothetical protein
LSEHELPYHLGRALQLLSGILWAAAYMLMIFKGFRDRVCPVPFAAMCSNLAWELLFTFVWPHEPAQLVINWVWLGLDAVIARQYLLYSEEFGRDRKAKWTALLLSLGLALLLNGAVTLEFHDLEGKYAAFGMNLMMSILFIRMLQTRGTAGQSLTIAYCKMGGTLFASLVFFFLYPGSVLLDVLYAAILIADGLYILMLNDRTAKAALQSMNAKPRGHNF